MRDYAALEAGPSDVRAQLTRELLGNFIALAWQEARGGAPGSAASGEIFELVLNKAASDEVENAPTSVREILQYRALPSGVQLEMTDLKVGAQTAGSIGRLNPTNVAPVYRAHPVEARFVLDRYSKPFPDVVEWVRRSVRQAAEADQATN